MNERRVIAITGASSGIGEALAKQLGKRKDGLVLAARRGNELERVARETGTDALPVVTDVTRRKDVEHLRDAAIKQFGHIDVWVNNAGRGLTKPVLELTDKEVDEIVAVVLKSVLYGMQTIIPHFKERGKGHVINVSSFLGRVPLVPYRSIYSAMKSAVNVLSSNTRMTLKIDHPEIYVSTVMPGVVETDFARVAGTETQKAGTRVGAMTVQSADEVASQIISLMDNPVPELYTNPATPDLAQQYYRDIGAFEENVARRFSGR